MRKKFAILGGKGGSANGGVWRVLQVVCAKPQINLHSFSLAAAAAGAGV